MINFRVLFIDYIPDSCAEEDMKTMKRKAFALKESLTNGPLVIFNDQVIVEKNSHSKYYTVIIDNIPDGYVKKVLKICKKAKPACIKINYNHRD